MKRRGKLRSFRGGFVVDSLPKLPLTPYVICNWFSDSEKQTVALFTADQMREYALLAVAMTDIETQHAAQLAALPKPAAPEPMEESEDE